MKMTLKHVPLALFMLTLLASASPAPVVAAPKKTPKPASRPAAVATPAPKAPEYSLADFLSDVRQHHLGVRGSIDVSQGARMRAQEGSLLLTPTIFSNDQLSSDSRPTASSAFQGNKTILNTYSLGVNQLTSFGLQGRLYYNMTYYSVKGASPQFITQPDYYQGSPTLEVTQSLWRNGFGREVRATQELLEAQALATSFGESYKVKLALADAELTYWRLALARETVLVSRENLQRAQKTRDWNAERVRLSLADKSDLLQAEAALQARRMEMQSALDEENAASRAFNTARGANSDAVPEQLDRIDEKLFKDFQIPVREELRDDVKAALQQQRAQVAGADIAREKNSPTLDAFANVSLTGKDPSLGTTTSDSFKTEHPYAAVGIRFSAPLDFGKLSEVRDGYAAEKNGAQLSYQRKLYEQERDWDNLLKSLDEARNRLGLSRMIETAQREKLMYERDRFTRGRTTTYQVIIFEQDYATAQLARIQAEAAVLRIIAQMKTFGGAL